MQPTNQTTPEQLLPDKMEEVMQAYVAGDTARSAEVV